ncbi:hypothetical protein TNCV_1655241 [Trichonephila clavipes]|nr:hypothetical protein TNCV_1655241 [Trichonephila clavipes]
MLYLEIFFLEEAVVSELAWNRTGILQHSRRLNNDFSEDFIKGCRHCVRKLHAASKRTDKVIPASTTILPLGFLYTSHLLRQSRSHKDHAVESFLGWAALASSVGFYPRVKLKQFKAEINESNLVKDDAITSPQIGLGGDIPDR